MAYKLPKGPRGDSPSDPGRRKKARKRKSVGAAIEEAGAPLKPKRSTGKAISSAGPKPPARTRGTSASGDRPSDRPDANPARKRAVKRQQAKDRARARREVEQETKRRLVATVREMAADVAEPVRKPERTTVRSVLLGRERHPMSRAAQGRLEEEMRKGKISEESKDAIIEGSSRQKAQSTEAVASVALKALNETLRVARGAGEAINASKPTRLPGEERDPGRAALRAIVTNKGDMPGDAIIPKSKKGAGWDAARLAGNIVGDPLTYVTVGSGTATKAAAKSAAKKATKRAVKRGASKRAADRAGRAAARKVARKRPQNNRGVSVGLRATIPGTSRPIIDVKTSGRASAAVSRAVKAPQAAEKLRDKGSGVVRSMPGTKGVRPAGRTPAAHTRIRQAQRELRAQQDAARRKGANVKRAVKRSGRNTTGAKVYERIESMPQGVSLGADETAAVARLVRRHLGESYDAKKTAGLADKPFRPRDIETRVLTKISKRTKPTYRIQARRPGDQQWQTVTTAPTRAAAEATRKQVHATAEQMVRTGRIPAGPDARRYAPHMRQRQTEHIAPQPMSARTTRTNAEKAREMRVPLAEANQQTRAGRAVKRRADDVERDLFTDDIAATTARHVQSAGEKVAESRFWAEVAKTGRPLGQVVREKGGVLDISQMPKGGMVYEVTPRGLRPLAKGSSGELDTAAVRSAVKQSGQGGQKFVVLDPAEVKRIAERVFPKELRTRGDEYAAMFDRTTGKWKWWLTIPNPSYHIRNLVGDSMNAWLGDANARALADATRVVGSRTNLERTTAAGTAAKASGKTIKVARKKKMTYKALLREAEDLGVIGLGQGGKELDDLIHAGGKQSRMFDRGPVGALSRANVNREDIPRLGSYLAARRRGMKPREAADHVIRHHFDYGDLNPADRGLRRAVPFATFWTRNVPLQAAKLVERPGKFATMAKTLDMAARQAGFSDYSEFASGLHDWQQDGIPVPVKTPWDGRLKVANIGPPQTDLNFHRWVGMLSGESGPKVAEQMGQDFLSRLNPLVKLPLELQQNRSFFFRGEIDPGQEGKGSSLEPAPDMPGPLRDFFGVVKYKDKDGKVRWGWDKTLAYAVRQSIPLVNRAVGVATPGMSERNQTPQDVLVSFAGVNISDFEHSVEKAATNRKYDRRDELRGRKRYLEDTQKTGGREYREVTRELKALEAEMRSPRRKTARKRGRGAFGGPGSGGGGAFGRPTPGSRGAFGASSGVREEVQVGPNGPESSAVAALDLGSRRAVADGHRQAPLASVAQSVGYAGGRETDNAEHNYDRQSPEHRQDGAEVEQIHSGQTTSISASVPAAMGHNEPELRSYARKAAEDVGYDPDVFEAQIESESGFDPDAVSPAGATGVAQIMPDTARAWGVNPRDARASLREAAKRMKGYLDSYDGDLDKALAAYNAGPGAVQQHGGVPPFAETRNYIAKIKAKAGSRRGDVPVNRSKVDKADDRILGGEERIVATKADTQPAERAAIAAYFADRDKPGALADLTTNLRTIRDEAAQEAATTTEAQPKAGKKTARKTGRFTGKASGDYRGAKGPADQLAKIGTDLGLRVTSTKRNNTNPYSGSRSDHDNGNRDAYAYDLSNGSRPTKEMDQAAFRIARRLGIRDYKFGTPINRTVRVGDVRVQIIYRGTGAAFGGNHMNHVHVGVKRV